VLNGGARRKYYRESAVEFSLVAGTPTALDGIDLKIERGEFVALVGSMS
jgi:ABC-type dipeptide/oligopeptide/nickel transport system ATPase component